jgi:signal peptide peptidase SppA
MRETTLRAMTETPWAILPGRLAGVFETVLEADEFEAPAKVEAWVGNAAGGGSGRRGTSVAVLPLYGVLVPRPMFGGLIGQTPLTQFSAVFRDLLDNPDVGSIIIDVDSPGGMMDGVPELAAEIRDARNRKPIIAIANTMAASAAYWIGAQADEFVASPSAMLGSIGVFAAHIDISAAQQKLGIKTTLISGGKYKTETSPFAPLTDEARVAIQERVDHFHGMFVSDVAKGRRVAVATVRDRYGEGRVLTATAARSAGMVDRIDTFEGTVGRMLREATGGTTSAMSAVQREAERFARLQRDAA